MFQMKDEMQTAVKHNIRGGEGSPSFRYLFSAEQLGGRAEMMAVITLQPGESVGVHPHETNGEAYVILEGAATVTEDGQARELHVGDRRTRSYVRRVSGNYIFDMMRRYLQGLEVIKEN